MDPVAAARRSCDDRGQALVVVALFIGVAAVAVVGLRDAQDRLLGAARDRRAGEAAVEAAVAVYADAFAHASADPLVAMTAAGTAARAAAEELSLANGGGAIDDTPVVICGAGSVEVSLALGGRTFRAGFEGSCSPR